MLKMPVASATCLLKGAVAPLHAHARHPDRLGRADPGRFEITARTAGNKIIAEAIMTARASIREGRPLPPTLKASGVFPAHGRPDDLGRRGRPAALDEMLTKTSRLLPSRGGPPPWTR